jgi:hypothetical protein
MPIQVAFIEPGIYLSEWIGQVTADEVRQSQRDGTALANTHQEKRTVLIVDFAQMRRFPIDISLLNRSAVRDPRLHRILLVNAPSGVRLVAGTLAKVYPKAAERIEVRADRADGLARAHELLASLPADAVPPKI